MRKLLSVLALVLLFTSSVLADDSKAQEILKQARQAIGGDEQLQNIQGLQINGQYRRVFGERQMGGDREISILLPNKYLVEDAMNAGGLSTAMINFRGLNGDKAWSGNSGGGGGMIFRMAGPGGQQASPEQMEAMLRRIYSAEFSRYLLAMILTPPPSVAVEYKYAGESEVEDLKADVIDVSGPDNFAVRVFFDKSSHLPLLLSYRGPKPRVVTMTRQAGSPAKPEDIKKAREEADKKMHAEAPAAPEEVDFYIRLTDHKKVGGVMLPHKLTFLTENEVSEEFEISKYQLNPQFKGDHFEKH
ncbi:MAG TPA: hypothetical protein VGQ41_25345 [Pyrinomonadaceae bacterium]|jgi:hypothetical protein|nr:hypothetical protein [Pyrinomonadaceae bacterium]